MRIDARRLPAFLRDPGGCRVVLLVGDDLGLIRLRGDTLTRAVAGDLHDPFRVTELAREAIGSLPDETATQSLTGGRRVVRVRDVTDAAVPAVKATLEGASDSLAILEGPGLATRSKLATLLEATDAGAVIRCYPAEGRDLEQAVEAIGRELGVSLDRDAVKWIAGRLGGDHGFIRQEMEKLALYAGQGAAIDVTVAASCLDDLTEHLLDEALLAATAGDLMRCDEALESSLAGGQSPVSALRAAMLHAQQLLRARVIVEAGGSVDEAVSRLRPPVFWRSQPAFKRALGLWDGPRLQDAAMALARAESACKRTGAPGEAICRRALLELAATAARLTRR